MTLRRWFLLLLLIGGGTACSPAARYAPPATGGLNLAVPQFVDAAAEAGLDFQHAAFRWGISGDPIAMMGGGLCWLDYNNDGWLDLFVTNSYAQEEAGRWERETGGLPRSTLFENRNGRFVDVGQPSGTALEMRGNGCAAGDLNRDGFTDLYVTTARFNLLLWNNGDGTFTEGGEEAAVDAYGWHSGAAIGDLNGDGWPEIFAAGYVDINNRIPDATLGFPNTHLGLKDVLFLNLGAAGLDGNGRPTFREIGELVGLESSAPAYEYGLGALFTDTDGDGDLDLYVANDTNPNRLYENLAWPDDPEGIGFVFAEIGAYAGVDDVNSGMGIAGGDYDGDGRIDLFVTNFGDQLHAAYHNQSAPNQLAYLDLVQSFGAGDLGVGLTGWGVTWADFDLDTDLDLLIVNGKVPVGDLAADGELVQYFSNLTAQGEPRFQELTTASGLTGVGPVLGRGSAMADFDNDGDLDVAINTIGGRLVLLENQGTAGRWLQVQLEGFAPGAMITAELADGRTLTREMYAGSSYLSSEDTRCHLGLGTASRVKTLTVRWPDGRETVLHNVAADQIIRIAAPGGG